MARVAFIGLGNMGGGMAANLAKAGHQVRAFDLSKEALARAEAKGCQPSSSAEEALADAEAVVTMLPAGRHVADVYRQSVLLAAPKSAILIDCSTIDPLPHRPAARAFGLLATRAADRARPPDSRRRFAPSSERGAIHARAQARRLCPGRREARPVPPGRHLLLWRRVGRGVARRLRFCRQRLRFEGVRHRRSRLPAGPGRALSDPSAPFQLTGGYNADVAARLAVTWLHRTLSFDYANPLWEDNFESRAW